MLTQKTNVGIQDSITLGNNILPCLLPPVSAQQTDSRHRQAFEHTEPSKTGPSTQSLADIERKAIIEALEKCLWIQKDAAEKLGISKRTINYKIKKLGIRHPRWRKNI